MVSVALKISMAEQWSQDQSYLLHDAITGTKITTSQKLPKVRTPVKIINLDKPNILGNFNPNVFHMS